MPFFHNPILRSVLEHYESFVESGTNDRQRGKVCVMLGMHQIFPANFSQLKKIVVSGCRVGRQPHSCWSILPNCVSIVRCSCISQRINGLTRFEQPIIMHKTLPIYPKSQHNFLRPQYWFRSCLWSFSVLKSQSLSHIIVVVHKDFITRINFFKKLFDFFSLKQGLTNLNSDHKIFRR